MPKIKCKFAEVVPVKKNKQNPVIAHFQNGELSDEYARNLDACIATDTQNDKNAKVLVTVSNNNVYDGYIGRDYPTDLKKTFLGIRNKNTNEIKLVEISECNLLSYLYNNVAKRQIENDSMSLNQESARRILFKDFGGKKAIKVLDRKEKMKVNVDVVKEQLDKTLMELSKAGEEFEDDFDKSKIQQDHILEEMVPKMNKEATKLIDVYKIEDLVGKEAVDLLDADAVKVLKTGIEDLPIKRKFLLNAIESVQRSKIPDDPQNILKVKACIYVDALITYFKQVNQVRQNKVVRMQSVSEVTSKLNDHIRKKFSQPYINKTTKTNYVVHKATCYIIVLSLLISERYEMDIQNIVEEIGISKTSLFKMINSIAVRPKAKSNIISIRVPSQLKTFSTTFRKRRTL